MEERQKEEKMIECFCSDCKKKMYFSLAEGLKPCKFCNGIDAMEYVQTAYFPKGICSNYE